jgi:transcriptional regulator with XRE-family HTH domain
MKGHDLLRQWLAATDTSVTDFAARCGVSRQTVYRWLRREGPREARYLQRIAAVTGNAVPLASWLDDAARS